MYDMSAMRNYAQCGLYTTHAVDGYSYLARLTTSSPQIFDLAGNMGIETVIGGKEAWIQYPDRSAVDHSYFATTSGSKVMGLPGCNDRVSCNLTSNSPIPMKLDSFHIGNYSLTNMTCTGTRCG
jgi:hypothetical protein